MKNFFAIIFAILLIALWIFGNLLKTSAVNPSSIFTKENILKTILVGFISLVAFYIFGKFKNK
jgi:hypothetical protein